MNSNLSKWLAVGCLNCILHLPLVLWGCICVTHAGNWIMCTLYSDKTRDDTLLELATLLTWTVQVETLKSEEKGIERCYGVKSGKSMSYYIHKSHCLSRLPTSWLKSSSQRTSASECTIFSSNAARVAKSLRLKPCLSKCCCNRAVTAWWKNKTESIRG